MLMQPVRPSGAPPEGVLPLASDAFDPADAGCWLSRGRSLEHAIALAAVWRSWPDLPHDAPLADRMERGRERIRAMRPINDAISAQVEAERQTRNFAFTYAKAADGSIDERDLAILRGRDAHRYDWDDAVAYGGGWYAAHVGWEHRYPVEDRMSAAAATRRRAYDTGFADGGGDRSDPFDAARRANLAALRKDNQVVPVVTPPPPRPSPSSWPAPGDQARPTHWRRRLLIVADASVEEIEPDRFRAFPLAADLSVELARHEAEGLLVVTVGRDGFVAGHDPSGQGGPLSSARADALIADPRHGKALRALLHGREIDDILVAAQGQHLRVIDAFASVLPLCRKMERTRNSALQQRGHLRCWLARGHAGDNMGAGHIRWGKAIKGLVGKLGEFTVRHAGPAPQRGHLVRVELADGALAHGYVTSSGEPLNPTTIVSNKAHLRREMAAALRAFGGATRLAWSFGSPVST